MKSYEIRKKFLDHFENSGHDLIPSSSLIPENDPTLLFNNAGMNPFKAIFTGEKPPPPSRRATSSQKCVRAGGKHNDLDNVGFTARHHTFFEMLGNFSFGDYFKFEAIDLSWKLLTQTFSLNPKRLYVSVYKDDDEAADIWKKHIGIPSDKIYRFGEKDNFWRMADTGPCGPCSEIFYDQFYDQGEHIGGDPKKNVMGGDGDRFTEIWNLVFMEYFEDKKGSLRPLPQPSIDTGMGLERTSAILQGQTNNYNTDLFLPLIEEASKIAKVTYNLNMPTDHKEAAALRVIADHARAVSFLLADGVIPSNEGRGYVLRRILRRAIRYARTLTTKSTLPEVCHKVIILMDNFFPELNQSKDFILQTVRDEQDRFLETLDFGTQLLQKEIYAAQKKNSPVLNGDFVFRLYDTYGFPSDLTELMAQEHGLGVDFKEFHKKLEEAKERSKSRRSDKKFSTKNTEIIQALQDLSTPTQSTCYTSNFEPQCEILKLLVFQKEGLEKSNSLGEGQTGFLICNRTPFYAEGGGQVSDTGFGGPLKTDLPSNLFCDPQSIETIPIEHSHFKSIFNVDDVQKYKGSQENIEIFVHRVTMVSGTLILPENSKMHLALKVDTPRRSLIQSNHSATHLLHYALREILGPFVKQAGSLVTPEKLRFDFTYKGPLSVSQIEKIETLTNQLISEDTLAHSQHMPYDKALKEGALALFGEKYSSDVRVMTLGPSKELCGGTHVHKLSEIKAFKILSEGSVSSGVRRIEALTHQKALEFLNHQTQELQTVHSYLGVSQNSGSQEVISYMERLKSDVSDLKKKLKALQSSHIPIDKILESKKKLENDIFYILHLSDSEELDPLRQTVDQLCNHIKKGIVIVTGSASKKTPIIVGVTKNITSNYHAGHILKSIALELGGRGGGRPEFAQGAIPTLKNIDKVVKSQLSGL